MDMLNGACYPPNIGTLDLAHIVQEHKLLVAIASLESHVVTMLKSLS